MTLKSMFRHLLAGVGLEVRRLSPDNGVPRGTDQTALQVALRNGLQINTVIDAGAAFGHWTRMCRELLPRATYLLIEPLAQYDDWLDPLCAEFSNVSRIKAAAADQIGQATFYLHDDWCGSSLYREAEGAQVDGRPTEVQVTTIDTLTQEFQLPGPFLLKADVQGAELKVLDGATATLKQTEFILLETSLFEFFKGGPLIDKIMVNLRQHGFVVYDILNPQYRLLDNALGQVDLVFVPVDSVLRREHVYASARQRQQQNDQFQQQRANQ